MNKTQLDLPRPYPDPNLYQSTLDMGFDAFPERRENYLKYQAAIRGAQLDYLPIKLDIENVSRCNYQCTMCVVSEWPKMQRAEDMSFEDYKALIDEQYGVVEIKLQGMGEPLMGKCYIEMIEYARNRHIWVRAITNGSLLHLDENYKRIIDADVSELHVSIDGASAEVYEKIRVGGRFDQVGENCKMLNAYANETGRRRTRMWSVVQKDNYHELEAMVDLAAEWGFWRATFSLDLEDWGHDHWREKNEQVDMRPTFDADRAQELVARGKEKGVEVSFWATYEKFDLDDPAKLCHWPFERAVVSSDMFVVPCCMVSQPELVNMGDAHNFSNEWHSDTYQQFRQRHLDGDLPEFCKGCYIGSGRKTGRGSQLIALTLDEARADD